MIEAIIRGEYDPVKLAELARRKLRKKILQLQQALRGSVTEHHRFLLRTQMDHLNHLEQLILQYSARIQEALNGPPLCVSATPRCRPYGGPRFVPAVALGISQS